MLVLYDMRASSDRDEHLLVFRKNLRLPHPFLKARSIASLISFERHRKIYLTAGRVKVNHASFLPLSIFLKHAAGARARPLNPLAPYFFFASLLALILFNASATVTVVIFCSIRVLRPQFMSIIYTLAIGARSFRSRPKTNLLRFEILILVNDAHEIERTIGGEWLFVGAYRL